ncbi:MAG: trypsin-like peptidase domain-containing protein [Deltaproteobacteria bacterium]|nr:trypsin-like peptidase domain-containing protein [Deltaproteobacteria bacterium]
MIAKSELKKSCFLLNGVLILSAACAEKQNRPSISPASTELTIADYCSPDEKLSQLRLSALFNENEEEIPDSQVNSGQVAWITLQKDTESHRFYSGVGRYGNCTGTLLYTSSLREAPAYIITNGHCVTSGLISPSGLLLNQTDSSGKKMYFNYYYGFSDESLEIIKGNKIAFASMDGTDAAIVELKATLGELTDKGICPFKLSSQQVRKNMAVQVAGVPLSGVSSSLLGLRLSFCSLGDTVSLREGSYSFPESFRHHCSIVGGNSGSPVISSGKYEIVGLVNTAVNDSAEAQEACSLNKPCEISTDGSITTNSSENYGQPTDYLVGCFDESGTFDHHQSSCGIKARFGI